jgi:hypothetical protein
MIVIVDQGGHPSAAAIALAAVAAGGKAELVAKVTDDATGDRRLHALTEAGVGHVATLRQPVGAATSSLDAADLELALRYLADATTIVVIEPRDDASLRAAGEAAGWARGTLIVVVAAGSPAPVDAPNGAIILEAPVADPDGAFAAVVATLAARLDGGMDPARAFGDAMSSAPSWTAVRDD